MAATMRGGGTQPLPHPIMTNSSRIRWLTLTLCLSLHTGRGEESASTPSAGLSQPAESPASPSDAHAQTVVYTELQPITVRARIARSPKGDSLRLRVVSGRTQDRLDRGVHRESPRLASLRQRRDSGLTPDLLDREVPGRSPKAESLLAIQGSE